MQVIVIQEETILYELRVTMFNKLKLWVKVKCSPFDTNLGYSDPDYYKWRKATKNEVLEYLRIRGR